MTDTSTCQACGSPLPREGGPCRICGWDPRTADPLPLASALYWPDDDALASDLERATTGEFEVEGLIGRGGMATVYLAREVALDRRVAIKVMAPHIMHGYGMAERFKREAKVAAGLAHANIIPIHAVRESGPLVCLVMKYLVGRSLDAILREHRPLPLPLVQVIIRDVAAGLDFAHQHGVVHRDVKPANIMVDEAGQVVITDFGIAKAREADVLTASGSTIGTPAYMSPEQALGHRATGASDQYSLGVVAYELLAGRMPFVAETAMGLMYQHTHTPPEPLESVNPNVSPEAARVVDRMLAKSPDDRFPSLSDASRELGIPPTVGTLDDPVRRELASLVGQIAPPRRRSKPSRPSRLSPITGLGPPTPESDAPTQPITAGWHRPWYRRYWIALASAMVLAVYAAADRSERLVPDTATIAPPPPAAAASPVQAPDRAETPAIHPTTRAARDSSARSAAAPKAFTQVVPGRATIEGAIERYRLAVESGDLSQIVAAYPAMRAEQVASYERFFHDASHVRFEVIVKDPSQRNGEAHLRLEGFLRFRDRRTGTEQLTRYRTNVRLVDGPTGWRILDIK